MKALNTSISDRLLLGSPLRRRPVAIGLASGLAVALIISAFSTLSITTDLSADALRVFVLALVFSSVASIVPVLILRYLDRRERESPWLLLATFLWGALIATGLALPLNTAFLRAVAGWVGQNPALQALLGPQAALLIAAPIAGPLVEETTKGLGAVLLFLLLRAEFDNMRDGLIYGALIGAGFNWFEAALYVTQNYVQYGFAPWGFQFGSRYAVFGLAGHALFTGMFGASLGLARQTTQRWVKIVAPIIGLGFAIAAHALNNGLGLAIIVLAAALGHPIPIDDSPPPQIGITTGLIVGSIRVLIIFLPFFLLTAVAVWRSGVWERRVIREELADEIGETITPEEYTAIERDHAFHTRRIASADRRHGRALVNAQNELAFRKRYVRNAGGDIQTDPLVIGWRAEVAARRLVLGGVAAVVQQTNQHINPPAP